MSDAAAVVSEAGAGRRGRGEALLLGVILLVALGLRVAAARGQLWLDEVWSVLLARSARSAADLFRGGNLIDNNHPLNTLWLYVVGDFKWYQFYRGPAVVAGVVGVWLAWRVGRRRAGATAGLVAAAALAVSYPSVLYASEARGYALAVCFALACVDVMWGAEAAAAAGRSGWRGPALYAVLAALGLLSHLTFLQFLVAAGVYTLVRSRYSLRETLAWHAAPAAAAGVMYWGFIRKMAIAGGPAADVAQVVADTGAVFVGGVGWMGAVAFGAAVGFAIARAARRRDPRAVFYVALVVAPFALLAAKSFLMGKAEIVYVRYFLVPATLLVVAAAEEMARALSSSVAARTGGAVVLAVFTAANLVHVTRLIVIGRGEPLGALAYVAYSSPPRENTVAAVFPDEVRPEAHDKRLSRLIEFYAPYFPAGYSVFQLRAASPAPPHWLLVSSASGEVTGQIDFHGARFALRRVFPHYGLSGWTWAIYRQEGAIVGGAG